MRFATKAFAAGMMLVAGIAFAETEATDPLVIAHHSSWRDRLRLLLPLPKPPRRRWLQARPTFM